MYILYDRVMRKIQNKHKRIKHKNLFKNARLQRKLIKFAENPISGFRVPHLGSRISDSGSHLWVGTWISGLGSHVYGVGSRVPGPTCEMGPESRVLGPTFRICLSKRYNDQLKLTISPIKNNLFEITKEHKEFKFRQNIQTEFTKKMKFIPRPMASFRKKWNLMINYLIFYISSFHQGWKLNVWRIRLDN